jgi:peptidylprolyl isomerase
MQESGTTQEKKAFRLKFVHILAIAVPIVVIAALAYFVFYGQPAAIVAVGDNVSIYYTGSFTNGTVFGSNFGSKPISFVVGGGQMISGVNNAVIGMRVGQTKNVSLLPEQAYGYINQTNRSYTVPISYLRNVSNLSVGEQFNPGNGYLYTVRSFNTTNATLEVYPVLAGHTLLFEIKVTNINK